MCGIAGYVTRTPSQEPESLLTRMTDVIRHRGPDGDGYYIDPYASLGHRRLSIIDVAGGAQPMYNEAGNLAIIFNGEIFNHASLRPDLERAGHRYRSHCDTETILHAYEQYGPACVERFRGMFTFVIWDRDTRTLYAARDRLGIKPFYYYWNGRLFVFASEIKALLEHPAITSAFDDSLLSEYLAFGYTSGEQTLFRGIRKLMPGHRLILRSTGEPEIERYWDCPPPQQTPRRTERDWIADCRTRLEETVRMRLMSDVPLGMFLSGGVDSSAIAALMKRMVSGPVETFAVGYREEAFSELAYARQVAEAIGTKHREVVIGMEDFFDALPHLIWHEDEPITWPSSVSLHFVSRLAAQHVKVVLTGEGSDELFGGYGRYHTHAVNQRWLPRYQLLPAPARQWIRAQVADSRLLNGDLRRKLQHTIAGRPEDFESLYLDNFYSAFSAEEQNDMLRDGLSGGAYSHYLHYWNAAHGRSILQRLLYADQKTYLVELLMKQDRMSMSASIESRVPFLDHTFVEFAASLPDGMKIRGGEGKYILKRAVEDLLPREIIYRKKMGFPTPLRDWLRAPRARLLLETLRSPNGLVAAYIDKRALESLLERHAGGRVDGTDRIWRLLNLQIWGDVFFNGGAKSIHTPLASAPPTSPR